MGVTNLACCFHKLRSSKSVDAEALLIRRRFWASHGASRGWLVDYQAILAARGNSQEVMSSSMLRTIGLTTTY